MKSHRHLMIAEIDNHYFSKYNIPVQTKQKEKKGNSHVETDTVAKACQPTAKDGGTLSEQEEVSDTK